MTIETEECFKVGQCGSCGGAGRVLLAGRCRTCTTNAVGGEVSADTLAALNKAYATASDRLLGPLS